MHFSCRCAGNFHEGSRGTGAQVCDFYSKRAMAHREVNSRKADRLPLEVGLRLRKPPVAPRVVPAGTLIRNHHGVRDWQHFLG